MPENESIFDDVREGYRFAYAATLDERPGLQASYEPERIDIPDYRASAVVVSGQRFRRNELWNSFLGEIAAGKCQGIILVFAQGGGGVSPPG